MGALSLVRMVGCLAPLAFLLVLCAAPAAQAALARPSLRNAIRVAAHATAAATPPLPSPGPIVIAHRGASGGAPENTLPAFRLALQEGADGFETDLRTSKDGAIVLVHDYTVNRTTNCSASAPPGQCRCGPVNNLTLAELKTCDAGSWKGPEWAGTQIPTLEEAVDFAMSADAIITMELKTRDESRGLLANHVAAIIDHFSAQSNVIVSCWTPGQVANMTAAIRTSPIQRVGYAPLQVRDRYFSRALQMGLSGFSVDYRTASQEFIYAAHRHLMPVWAWTVNEPAVIKEMLAMGVDGVLTDEPALVRSIVAQLL